MSVDLRFSISQVVKIGGNLSSSLTLSSGTFHGFVLSPMLYSLFTYDFIPSRESTEILTEIC